MGCLREAIPKLTRSAVHRFLQRHGLPRFNSESITLP
jgi:hypothetical protein